MTKDKKEVLYVTEPRTVMHLCIALENLAIANEVTKHGFISDYICNATSEIRKALRIAIGEP